MFERRTYDHKRQPQDRPADFLFGMVFSTAERRLCAGQKSIFRPSGQPNYAASGSVPPKTEIREHPADAAKVLILDDITPAAMAAATVTPTAVQHRRQRNLRSIALMRHFFAVNWKKRIVLRIFFQMILSPFCQFRKDRQQCFTFFGQ